MTEQSSPLLSLITRHIAHTHRHMLVVMVTAQASVVTMLSLASNPGPHHDRICDRREEGLVKPPFCFGSLPTIAGKISHSNYLAQSAVFKSVFDSQTRRGVARRRLSLSRYKHKANPSLGLVDASTWSKKAQRKGRRLFGSEIFDSLDPEIYSPLWTKCFSFLFFSFPFFFVAPLPVGENTSLLPCWSNTSSAQGASSKRGPDLLSLFERRDVYSRWTMRQLPVCHAEGVLCLSSWQQSWTNPAIADEAFLARCWSGRLPQPGKAKSLLRKTWQTYRQGYKPQRLYK